MPRLPADIRISLKERGGPTYRIELVQLPVVGRRYWVRRNGKHSTEVPEATATQIASDVGWSRRPEPLSSPANRSFDRTLPISCFYPRSPGHPTSTVGVGSRVFAPRASQLRSRRRSYARAEVATLAQSVGASPSVLPLPPAVYATAASAPVKAFDQKGESPFQARRYRPVVDSGNCVSVRKGGEQPETNDQSVTKVNSIRPSLSGRILAISEPWTVRRVNPSILWISPWDRHGQPRRCSNG